MSNVEKIILEKVRTGLKPVFVELQNESHMHAGPATESHFKLILASNALENMSKVKRHQLLYRLLADQLAGPVHALALHLYTEAEWELAKVPESPQCSNK